MTAQEPQNRRNEDIDDLEYGVRRGVVEIKDSKLKRLKAWSKDKAIYAAKAARNILAIGGAAAIAYVCSPYEVKETINDYLFGGKTNELTLEDYKEAMDNMREDHNANANRLEKSLASAKSEAKNVQDAFKSYKETAEIMAEKAENRINELTDYAEKDRNEDIKKAKEYQESLKEIEKKLGNQEITNAQAIKELKAAKIRIGEYAQADKDREAAETARRNSILNKVFSMLAQGKAKTPLQRAANRHCRETKNLTRGLEYGFNINDIKANAIIGNEYAEIARLERWFKQNPGRPFSEYDPIAFKAAEEQAAENAAKAKQKKAADKKAKEKRRDAEIQAGKDAKQGKVLKPKKLKKEELPDLMIEVKEPAVKVENPNQE